MLLISDANILIDFDCCGLLDKLFALPDTLAIPDTLYDEELAERHPELIDLGLQRRELNGENVLQAALLGRKYPGTSINDRFALRLAVQCDCPLLTGDGALRKAAIKEKLRVHGTLWLARRMHQRGIVTRAELKTAFTAMKEKGSRLPWHKVRELLDDLEDE